MSENIGKVGIEVSVDNGKLDAGIADAKRSIRSFGAALESNIGTATKKASASIDNYVRNLQTAAATQGKSARETELYKLALRGASAEQLGAANSALKLAEGYRRGEEIGNRLRVGFVALAAAAAAAATAGAAGTIALINQVGNYQDLAEKIGDTAVNISSLKTASDVTGTSLDTIASASVRLTATLSKTDDESKAAGQAIKALGLDFQTFKAQSPVEQLQAVAGALEGFADGSEKSAVAVALFGKSGADLLGFLKEYGSEGLKAAYVTDEQVKAADDLGDSTAKLKSQFQQFLQGEATKSIPLLRDIGGLFSTITKEQNGTSVASELLKGAIGGLVTVLQTVGVVGSEIGFVFLSLGREIGAIAAQAVALANFDFKGFSAISAAVKEDGVRARAELDKFQSQLLSIGTSKPLSASPSPKTAGSDPRPKLSTAGLVTGNKTGSGRADNTSAQEAKARLSLDLDAIRKDSEALSNTISNSEKILEATRSAALISEADFYARKRALIQDNNAVQVEAAKKEIERLQAEKLTGKDQIENARKIADAQAKLTLLRDNGAASLQVLAIQEQSALASISRAYQEARDAAQSYFDQTQRARQSELSGFGQGNQARGRELGLNQIREKFEQQRQELQRANRDGKFIGRADDYQRELALIEEFQAKELAAQTDQYRKLDAKRADFALGAREGLQNYYDEASDVYGQTERLISNSFKGAEDALVEFVTTGKLSFSSLANSILNDLARIAIQQSITKPLSEFLLNSGGSGGGALINAAASFFGGGKASGGPVGAGKLYEVNERGPELLNVAGRQYLMMGAQGGSITPNNAIGGGGKTINVTVNQTYAANTSRATSMQAAVDARRQLEAAARNV